MPEDTALYFFAGTTAPSRWYAVIPPDLPPGEATAKYVDALERANLRYVVVPNRATPEYERPLFGVDYGRPIFAWERALPGHSCGSETMRPSRSRIDKYISGIFAALLLLRLSADS